MKFQLSSLLTLLLPAAIVGQTLEEELYIYDCQVQYNIQLSANYPENNKVAKCNDAEMFAITNMIHSVVEQDYISSMLGVAVPDFMMAYEAFAEGAVLVPDAPKVPKEVIAEHMTTSDIMMDIAMNGCGDEDPMCLGLEDDDTNTTRRLLEVEEKETDARRLQEFEQEVLNSGPLPTEWTQMEHIRRKLPAMDCEVYGSCRAAWCCGICNHCRRRRRGLRSRGRGRKWWTGGESRTNSWGSWWARDNQVDATEEEEEASTEEETTTEEEKTNNGKAVGQVDDVAVRTNGQAETKEEQRAIQMFEKRVGDMIKKQLRRLAREGGAKCLGNFWELEVDFTRHFFEYV